jgi:hypothetical protein
MRIEETKKKPIIAITYDGDTHESKHLIDKITPIYVYYTNGWTGEKLRYNKMESTFETRGRSKKEWFPYNENVGIIQVDIIE